MINRTCSFTLLLSPFQGDKRLLEKHRERMRSSHTVEVCVCAQSERITGRLAHSLSQICSPVQLTTHSADHRHRIKTTKPRKEAVSTARAGRGRPEPITPHSITKDHHKTPRLLASFLKNASATPTEKYCSFVKWHHGNTIFLKEVSYAVKRLIASKTKVFVYIIYECVLCIFIMYI